VILFFHYLALFGVKIFYFERNFKTITIMTNEIINFENTPIRKVWRNEEWYFAVVDVIAVLTETERPRKYWSDLKKKLTKEGFNELSDIFGQLKVPSADGKSYNTDCANTKGILRIAMSVPSPKVEPLRLWLAEQGSRAIEETENPELGFDRMKEIYKAKGYTDEWIKERMQSIETRKRLTDEWKARGVQEGKEYSILTAIIAKGTFDLTPSEHKDIKGLSKPSENLRDHMTPLELIFTSLGEELTRNEAINEDAQGFDENRDAAVKGGDVAGKARKLVESESGKKVISTQNYLNTKELPPNK
jgi:DNA-damage-inducible protein D